MVRKVSLCPGGGSRVGAIVEPGSQPDLGAAKINSAELQSKEEPCVVGGDNGAIAPVAVDALGVNARGIEYDAVESDSVKSIRIRSELHRIDWHEVYWPFDRRLDHGV